MKYLLNSIFILSLSLFVVLSSCNSKQTNGYFGQEFETENVISVDEAEKMAENGLTENEVKVKGTIRSVCKGEGCWLTFTTSSGKTVYINTLDKAYSLPLEVEGKNAIAYGTILSIEQQKEEALAEGYEEDDLDWIDNFSITAKGIYVE